MNSTLRRYWRHASMAVMVACAGFASPGAHAAFNINEDVTGFYSYYDWTAFDGACMTAGLESTTFFAQIGNVPPCLFNPYYVARGSAPQVGGVVGALPDFLTFGPGALRLTNGDFRKNGTLSNFQKGGVVSNFVFPSNIGLHFVYTVTIYAGNGDAGEGNSTWEDLLRMGLASTGVFATGGTGMSFFLADGAEPPHLGSPASGLGYACSSYMVDPDGVRGGYISIGLGEEGIDSGPIDPYDLKAPSPRRSRVSLRRSGNTNWYGLNKLYPTRYPSSLGTSKRIEAVANTCKTGHVWDYSSGTGVKTMQKLDFNYRMARYYDMDYVAKLGVTLLGTFIGTELRFPEPIAVFQGFPISPRSGSRKITFDVTLSTDGLLDVHYSINGGSPEGVWMREPIQEGNSPLPRTFRFGFAASTSNLSNVHEITCFKVGPASQSESSAAANIEAGTKITEGTQVYLAFYHPLNAWSELTSHDLKYDTLTDRVSITSKPNWDANCVLTGGMCNRTSELVAVQQPATRTMLTSSSGLGVPFQWASLNAAQKASISSGDPSATEARLQFLRGDRSLESTEATGFRLRTSVLGDIISSNPALVGPPSAAYPDTWVDSLYPTAVARESGQRYTDFKAAVNGRSNILYVGSNDGFLHGFRAGSTSTSGVYNPANNDGREVLAFMPRAAFDTIHSKENPSVDYSHRWYGHNYFVDAPPASGDLFYNGAWHTWLVGGIGVGGNPSGPTQDRKIAAMGAFYALDVTNPAAFAEDKANAIVIGDWTSSTLRCAGIPCGADLGSVVGTPSIRRLHNGDWAVIFGNGLKSVNGRSGLFLMLVKSNGSTDFKFLPAGQPTTSRKNGMANVTPVDLDGDQIVDYVYGGDAHGYMWRFDLTSNNPANWAVAPRKMFTAEHERAITSKAVVATVKGDGGLSRPRVMVVFGTGERLPQTMDAAASFASDTHFLFGVWDSDMSAWNAKSPVKFEVLTANPLIYINDLQDQRVTDETGGDPRDPILKPPYRIVSQDRICWRESTVCGSDNTKYGWRLMLSGNHEQIVYDPVIAFGMLIVNTVMPGSIADTFTNCIAPQPTGFTFALDLASGGAPSAPFFADPGDGSYVGKRIGALGLNGTGSPFIVTANKKPYLIQQTVSGKGAVTAITPFAASTAKRLTWVNRR